ncbi:uroporphyrinogen decarboxylase [Natronoglycomyces albus]|uniref:Uroporphyrinogen decarboxylase n=1 Tax=Natronoglycomyces albus TaxID=2811108 RepID=A0A895XUE9_9ACTN|nr:uroporphyrinogen decarboxylase [Natronoglycomyces albus]
MTTTDTAATSPFLAACRGEKVSHTPVWFMRQAGRSLPEYKEARAGTTMLDACANPELVCEITMQPVRRYGVDAAVFFSDIVVPLRAIGIDVEIVPGTGPVIANPVRTEADLKRLRDLEPDDVPYITEAIGLLRRELGETPLIGFAGAPFTLASYLVEGAPSRNYTHSKTMMRSQPDLWNAIASRLAAIAGQFLRVQVDAGAQAVQLFDSWAGALSESDYRRLALPHSRATLASVAGEVPSIHFGVGTTHLLEAMSEVGTDVMGIDWRTPLSQAAKRLPGRPLQGNLDPTAALADPKPMLAEVDEVLSEAARVPGHIFNLGHGVLPETNPDALKRITDHVHEKTAE